MQFMSGVLLARFFFQAHFPPEFFSTRQFMSGALLARFLFLTYLPPEFFSSYICIFSSCTFSL